MKKSYYIVAIMIILAAAGGFYFFLNQPQGGEGKKIILKSSDKVVTLEIPENALPEGITENEIVITPETDETEQDAPLIYRIEPEGLQFKEPVTITFTADLAKSDRSIPLLLHESGEGEDIKMEIIDDLQVDADFDARKIIVKAPISHLSDFHLRLVGGLFEAFPTSPSTSHTKGEEFVYSTEIRPTGKTIRSKPKHNSIYIFDYSVAPGTTWSINGKLRSTFRPIIEPELVDFEGKSGIPADESYEINGNFTCANPDEEWGGEPIMADYGVRVKYTIREVTLLCSWSMKDYEEESVMECSPTGQRDVKTSAGFLSTQFHQCTEEGQWVHVCQPYMIICDPGGGSSKGFVSGSYKCNPQTGELILNEQGQPVDSETGRPPGEMCPP